MRNHTYVSPGDERMDVSFFNYFSTVSLGLMCYSFFKPGLFFELAMFFTYGFARTIVTTYNVCNKYICTPYIKHIKKPLMRILNIDNGLYEIEIVKDGEVIHRFKTMSEFIKYNTIKFVNDDQDDSGSDSDSESGSKTSERENKDENEKVEEWPEQVWQDVWSPEYGWVQTLQALETKLPREDDDETPQDFKVPRTNKCKGKARGKR